MNIEKEAVYDAIRRGYSDLSNADESTIDAYFADVDIDSISGHVGNIKGILFEQEYVDQLQNEGIDAVVYEEVNHPMSDVMILENGEVVEDLQLKATESVSYVQDTLNSVGDDVTVVTTTEVAQYFDREVIDSGISESLLEEAVSDVIMPISPITIVKLFFGIF
jgi:hypothetical protein